MPGDLILVSSLKPGIIARAIRRVQLRGGYHPDDACWEHAAVYIGSESICEANRNGVNIKPIFDYMCSHLIRIRRNPNLTSDQRWSLAVHAVRMKNFRYGFMSIVELYFKSRKGFWHNEDTPIQFPKSSVYCSQLYANAHGKICVTALGNNKSGEVTPASLSLDTTLVDVDTITWVKIA